MGLSEHTCFIGIAACTVKPTFIEHNYCHLIM